ncbi:MAG: hypothetical protein IKX24_12200 [Prevotella sp.]|nr:hypothetical protein [Prevotella sp.]
MKKYYLGLTTGLLVAIVSLGFASCSSDDDEPSQASILQKADGIIQLKSGIGDWDAAYLTNLGYFCYKKDVGNNSDPLASKYASITFMPADGSDMVSLISTKSDNIPTQMVTKKGIVYFSFPNDSILELLYDDSKTVEMLDSIAYSKADIISLSDAHNGDVFKTTLSAAASLLRKSTARNAITDSYGDAFEKISNQSYSSNAELENSITKSESGDYKFTEAISEWYEGEIGEYVCNTLSLWTGKATYKVGGSSCTLSGTIWCPSNTYNEYGTYGIICDADVSRLTLDAAEYKGLGYQSEDELSYGVDFRGFKPNTTYYYKAYYKFNNSNHGNLAPRHGSKSDQVIYDTTVKSFTTGDNILSVDVVMCIDVTGSMSGIINTVKRNAISFYDLFKQSCDEEEIQLADLNAQVIAFRDKNEDRSWLQTSSTYSLPEQRSEFDSFVNGLYANGGGDTPESGLEALQAAFSKTDWSVDDGYHRQVIILWTDAPYLIGSYSNISLSTLETQWNSMPSGRRLILFAPYGSNDYNGASWGNLDGWTNLIHESDLYSGFNNFDYILKSIIGELTSKAKTVKAKNQQPKEVYFRPNN